MQAEVFVLAAKDAPFELKTVTLDECQPNEVLVEVVACGLCHTDLCIQNGAFPSPFPSITGHEGSGRVLKVGSDVTRVVAGDEVLLSFSYCENCGPCRTGHPAACEKFGEQNFGRVRNASVGAKGSTKGPDGEEIFGTFFGQSSFGTHALVVESSIVKVPNGSDLEQLAPLGCGLQTGAGGIINLLKPSEKDTVLITGLGAVGFGALFAAKYLKVGTIVVVDIVDERLELAKTLGATHAINGKTEDLVAQIKKLTPYGSGVSKALEATGNVRVLRNAYEATMNGGHLLSCGTPGPGNNVPIDIFENVIASKTYTGLSEGDSNPPEFVPFLIKLYEEGHFPIDKISKKYSYKNFDDAVHAMHNGSTVKPIITFKS